MDEKINNKNIIDINISRELKNSFLDYSMSVIVSRALPDIRDGLKPVHRRIIYAMTKLNILSSGAFKKSARIVGEVIGKYHPHGDTSVYEAMVKMAQDFNYLHPLVLGQGNFGSIDGDNPAAMRYTEAKLSKISNLFIEDLEKNTVPFVDNYDNSEKEPLFLPCKYPNLLVNGSYGIAVGLATNIPPHNLGEIIDGLIALIKNPDISINELMDYIKGPDFPTSAIMTSDKGLYEAYTKGIGQVKLRARSQIIKQNKNNKKSIIITEIPYKLNKSKLLEKIAELINKREILDIVDLRDESNREGIKIVIELKKTAQENVVLNKLFKLTPLQSSFSINMVSLVNNQPKLLSLKEILQHFIDHSILLIFKKSKFDFNTYTKKLHILNGLIITLDNIDEVVKILKKSNSSKEASLKLIQKFKLSTEQTKAILEMKLQKITNLEKLKIQNDIVFLTKELKRLEEIINNKQKQYEILIKDQLQIKSKFAIPRRTEIISGDIDIDAESLIKDEKTIIVMSENNYIKRLDSNEITTTNRRTKGQRTINKEFKIQKILSCSTLDDILFLTNKGNFFKIRAYQISKYQTNNSKGLPIINLLPNLESDEKIQSFLAIKEADYDNKNIILFTKNGGVKKTSLSLFKRRWSSALIGFKLSENDSLVNASLISNKDDSSIVAVTKLGLIVCTNSSKIRLSGKTAKPLSFIKISKKDDLIGGCSMNKNKDIILVSENGIGKLLNSKLRETGRNVKGVIGMKLNEKTGNLQYIKEIEKNNDLIIVSKNGFLIRLEYKNLPILSRQASGSYLINLEKNDKVKLLETLKGGEK